MRRPRRRPLTALPFCLLLAGCIEDRLSVDLLTLVLPYSIRRSNTCASGDTAVWEFDEQDLYGRGFEMMAMASAP